MFSILNRIRAGALGRVLIILTVVGFVGVWLAPGALAREEEPKPYIHPGDAEGVGGYKYWDFEELPSETTQGLPGASALSEMSEAGYRIEETGLLRLLLWHFIIVK